jgi:hypothetical protein
MATLVCVLFSVTQLLCYGLMGIGVKYTLDFQKEKFICVNYQKEKFICV